MREQGKPPRRQAPVPSGKSTMGAGLGLALILGLLSAPGLYAQDVTRTTAGSSTLQQWLVGLAAVLGFLGLVFVSALVNRCFFSSTRGGEDDEAEMKKIEVRKTLNVYENMAVDTAEEGPSDKAETASDKVKVEDEKLAHM